VPERRPNPFPFFIVAAACLAGSLVALRFDHAVIEYVEGLPLDRMRILIRSVSDAGGGMALLILFVGVLVVLNDKKLAARGLVALTLAGVSVNALKLVIGRDRPSGRWGAYPSGHTTAVFTAAVILTHRFPKFGYLFYMFAGVIGVSRVFRLRHYPADVLAGVTLGLMMGLAGIALADHLEVDRYLARLGRAGPVLFLLLVIGATAGYGISQLGPQIGPALTLWAMRLVWVAFWEDPQVGVIDAK